MARSASPSKSKTPADDPSADKPVSFESAMADLQQIVTDLEDNTLGLEASLAQFEKGIGLLRQCHSILEQAEQKIEVLINFNADGGVTTAPFDATPTAGGADAKTLF